MKRERRRLTPELATVLRSLQRKRRQCATRRLRPEARWAIPSTRPVPHAAERAGEDVDKCWVVLVDGAETQLDLLGALRQRDCCRQGSRRVAHDPRGADRGSAAVNCCQYTFRQATGSRHTLSNGGTLQPMRSAPTRSNASVI